MRNVSVCFVIILFVLLPVLLFCYYFICVVFDYVINVACVVFGLLIVLL